MITLTVVHVTMVKKTLLDGSDCRKCADVTRYLEERGLWSRVDEVVWAKEGDPESPGQVLAARLGVERAPFFVVRGDDGSEAVYENVTTLIKERLGAQVSTAERARDVDPDDIGGI